MANTDCSVTSAYSHQRVDYSQVSKLIARLEQHIHIYLRSFLLVSCYFVHYVAIAYISVLVWQNMGG